MEPFSLLKFWRNAGSDVDSLISPTSNVTKVDVRDRAPETHEETDDDHEGSDDDGDGDGDGEDSFFDLVFTAPDCYDKQVKNVNCDKVSTNDSSSKAEKHEDSINNLIELEFPLKAKVLSVDSNTKPQSPISLLKSAPKFRVFLLGFRKSKSEKSEANGASNETTPKHQFQKSSRNEQSKRFTVKCKVEEIQIGSLFSKDNSLRSKLQREGSLDFSINDVDSSKPLSKDVPMYLKLIKPLYIRASKRYNDNKTRFPSDQLSTVSPLSSPATLTMTSPRKLPEEKRGNRSAGFRAVSKHLGKSRSASSTVGTMSSPINRRDDSLLVQHDGIQSAIMHCKRSYTSTAKECSGMMMRDGTSMMNPASNLSGEGSRCSSI